MPDRSIDLVRKRRRWVLLALAVAISIGLGLIFTMPLARHDGAETTAGLPGRGGFDYTVVEIFYGTDRNYTGADHPRDKYGADRGEQIHWGKCEVSIPHDHRMGELEEPSIWRLEFREDPEKHVVLLEGVRYDRESFLADVGAAIAAASGSKALVFVHGYNVTFEDAARRAAQIAYDLAFDGAPIFFSWPSDGSKAAYAADEGDIEWSTPHLREFLTTVAAESGAEEIFLIAHSMGNRGVTRALIDLEPEVRARFREVILTAPDVDADVFKEQILPAIQAEGSRITLYASSNDLALKASQGLHKSPRAGEAGDHLVVAPGIDTIDASSVETSFLGHSYFADGRSVISDLFYLIGEGKGPDERFGLVAVRREDQTYWEFRP